MNKFYLRIAYDNSKKNKIKIHIREVGQLAMVNKNGRFFMHITLHFGGNILTLNIPIEHSYVAGKRIIIISISSKGEGKIDQLFCSLLKPVDLGVRC